MGQNLLIVSNEAELTDLLGVVQEVSVCVVEEGFEAPQSVLQLVSLSANR